MTLLDQRIRPHSTQNNNDDSSSVLSTYIYTVITTTEGRIVKLWKFYSDSSYRIRYKYTVTNNPPRSTNCEARSTSTHERESSMVVDVAPALFLIDWSCYVEIHAVSSCSRNQPQINNHLQTLQFTINSVSTRLILRCVHFTTRIFRFLIFVLSVFCFMCTLYSRTFASLSPPSRAHTRVGIEFRSFSRTCESTSFWRSISALGCTSVLSLSNTVHGDMMHIMLTPFGSILIDDCWRFRTKKRNNNE